MKHYGDICGINGTELPPVDVICGGSPCQDLSVAGPRKGLDGERSGLFMEQIRIIKEMRSSGHRDDGRSNEPVWAGRYAIWENVPGAFSSNGGKDFQAVLTEFVRIADPSAPDVPMPDGGRWTKAGCLYDEMGKWSLAWRTHDLQYWGCPQRRKRICVLVDFCGLTAPWILFDPQLRRGPAFNDPNETVSDFRVQPRSEVQAVGKGLSRDSESGGETRESAAAGTESGAGGTSYTLKIRGGVERDSNGRKAGKGPLVQEERSGTLGVSQDQTLIQSYSIGSYNSGGMQSSNPKSGIYSTDMARTIDATGGSPACNNGGIAIVQPTDYQAYGLDQQGGKGGANYSENLCPPILSDSHGTPHAVAFTQNQRDEVRDLADVAGSVSAESGTHQTTYVASAVDCRNGTENLNTNGTLQAKSNGGYNLNCNSVVRVQACDVYNKTVEGDVSPTVTAATGGANTSVPKVLTEAIPINTMVGTRNSQEKRTTFGIGEPGDPQFTLSAAHEHAVFSAGFSFGQSANARSLGYEKEKSPTIRGGEGGNQKPVVLQVDEDGSENR